MKKKKMQNMKKCRKHEHCEIGQLHAKNGTVKDDVVK